MTALTEAIKNNHTIDIREHLDEISPKYADLVREKMAELESRSETAEALIEKGVSTLTKNRVGFYALGMSLGTITGYFISRRFLETKFSKIAEEEISEMREHYQAKGRALDAEAAKRPISEIIKERGYDSPDKETHEPPMAVRPPDTVIVSDSIVEDQRSPTGPAVEIEQRNVFRDTEITHEWDWHRERSRRSTEYPYVVHYDEREEFDSYTDVTLTYYEGDDVLCNERDEIIDPSDREGQVGEKNLERFGHGSNDASIVYIRNDKLEILYEVVKSPNNYAEEVHGFRHDAYDRSNLERMRARERDERDD